GVRGLRVRPAAQPGRAGPALPVLREVRGSPANRPASGARTLPRGDSSLPRFWPAFSDGSRAAPAALRCRASRWRPMSSESRSGRVEEMNGLPVRPLLRTDPAHRPAGDRLARGALGVGEEDLRQLVEGIDFALWIAAPDLSRVLYISPAF